MITTAILNDPKPARGVNWAGHPMKEGEDYYGKTVTDAPQSPAEAPTTRPEAPAESRPRKRRQRRKSAAVWTAEKRAEIGARMRAWHAARKAGTPSVMDTQSTAQQAQSPSVTVDGA